MNERRISPKSLTAAGWTREGRPATRGEWRSRFYRHRDGWVISHCEHPTALWPYLLVDPTGQPILMGAAGPWRNPDYGTAWATVAQAVNYVAEIGLTYQQLLEVCRWR